jgi:hypothetical protein
LPNEFYTFTIWLSVRTNFEKFKPDRYFLLLTLTLQLPSVFDEELSAAISKMAQC